MNNSIGKILASAREQLANSSPSVRADAEALLCHVLDCNSAHLIAHSEQQLDADQQQQYRKLIQHRSQGKPVAHLTGKREFWSLEFAVTPATLIPRPETETLIEFVLDKFDDTISLRLADLGTGSGAIAIAIASERPNWEITATDISAECLEIAQENATTHQVNNICFKQGNWFEALDKTDYDIVISNPPYIAESDTHLSTGDVRFESITALASGIDGMKDINQITQGAKQYLKKNGWLILEHGFDQKKSVLNCYKNVGYQKIIQINDLANQPRMTAGRHE